MSGFPSAKACESVKSYTANEAVQSDHGEFVQFVLKSDYDEVAKQFKNSASVIGRLIGEKVRLEAGIREIAQEVSFVGCEGSDDAVCIETAKSKEDWCPYCRIGTICSTAQRHGEPHG